jgi:hypothetical protein
MITDDIYCAAYLSVSGLKIIDISVSSNGKGEKVIFSLAGENEERITEKFEKGIAEVNIKDYLYKLFEIRNVMYSMKNARKTEGRSSVATSCRSFGTRTSVSVGGQYESRYRKD